MNLSFEEKDGVTVVTVIRDLANIELVSEFKDSVFGRIENGSIKFIIDFSSVNLIDSTFLGVLVVTHKKLVSLGGEIKISSLRESVALSFGLSKLSTIFKIYNSLDEAINSF